MTYSKGRAASLSPNHLGYCRTPSQHSRAQDEVPYSACSGIHGLQEALLPGKRCVNRRFGAVLSQQQDNGHYHPVAYASHSLKGGELKYHSSQLEFLALKWAMTEQFREYLQYQPFFVRTDNNLLNLCHDNA